MNKALAQLDFLSLVRLFPDLNGMEGDVVMIVVKHDEVPNLASVLVEVGERLLKECLGDLEHTAIHPETFDVWAFYNTPSAPEALPRCKAILAELEILSAVRVLYALPVTNLALQYYPEDKARFAALDHFAFAQNLDPDWFRILGTVGLDIVLVHLQPAPGQCIEGDVPEKLGEALRAANAGEFDSLHCAAGHLFCIYHVRQLARAAAVLKAELAAHGLLPVTRLMHRESAAAWRCWYSPVPAEISALVTDEKAE